MRQRSRIHDPATQQRIRTLRDAGCSLRAIAGEVGLPYTSVCDLLSADCDDDPDDAHLAPSPEEIIERAREIRHGWSPRKRLRRTVCPPDDWSPTVHRVHLPGGSDA